MNSPNQNGVRRKVVCLCGSTRYHEEYVEANLQETLAGHIVLSVGVFGHHAKEVHGREIDLAECKDDLDALHLDKIRLADEILVIGTPGDSTSREIAFAQQIGKKVRYFQAQ